MISLSIFIMLASSLHLLSKINNVITDWYRQMHDLEIVADTLIFAINLFCSGSEVDFLFLLQIIRLKWTLYLNNWYT